MTTRKFTVLDRLAGHFPSRSRVARCFRAALARTGSGVSAPPDYGSVPGQVRAAIPHGSLVLADDTAIVVEPHLVSVLVVAPEHLNATRSDVILQRHALPATRIGRIVEPRRATKKVLDFGLSHSVLNGAEAVMVDPPRMPDKVWQDQQDKCNRSQDDQGSSATSHCRSPHPSRRISRAAFRPHAPMTPPPGWVAAPHR